MKDSFKDFIERLSDNEIKKIWNNHTGIKKKIL